MSATIALYRSDGTETALPRATSRSDSATTSRASSHIQGATPSWPGGSPIRSWKLVCVKPGHTAVTVTPRPAYRPFAQRLKLMSQPLHAPYVERGMKPATDAMLTMRPLPRCEHRAQRGVGEAHRHLDVQLEVPHLVLDVVALEREWQPEAGVVHEHVDRMPRVGQPAATRVELLRVEQIGGEHLDVDAVLRGELIGQVVAARSVARHENEVGAAGRELPGVLGAQAGARAGDQCGSGHANEPSDARHR